MRLKPFYMAMRSWLTLFPVLMCVPFLVIPVMLVRDAAVVPLIWYSSVLLPAAAGITVGFRTWNSRSTEATWMLPGIRQIFHRGSWLILAGVIVLTATSHSLIHSSPITGAGIAALSYAVTIVLASGTPNNTARVIAAALPVALFYPEYSMVVITILGPLLGIGAFAIAFLLMKDSAQAEAHRRSIFNTLARLSREPSSWKVRLGLENDMHARIRHSYHSRGRPGWIKAGFDGISSSPRAMLTSELLPGTYFAYFGYSLNNALWMMVPLLAGPKTAILQPDLLYPCHRKTRADATTAVLLTIISAALMFVFVLLKLLTTFRPLHDPDVVTFTHPGAAFACLALWLPVILWHRLSPKANRPAAGLTGRYLLTMLAGMIGSAAICLALTLYSIRFYVRMSQTISPVFLLAMICVGAGITYTTLIVFTRRRYYREDLV